MQAREGAMYLEFFGLSEKPFSNTPDMQFFYLGRPHERALESLKYGIREQLGFLLLTGEVGAGKTTLSRALLARLDEGVETALLLHPLLTPEELLKSLAKDFGLTTRAVTQQKLVEALQRFLVGLVEKGKIALVVIDEAQNLSRDALETIRLLSNLETDKNKLLQILLVGQPELLKMLKNHDLRQLDQRITTRAHLEPLSHMEMMRYINFRVSQAQGSGKIFFEPKAYKALYAASRGYPRLINIIADRALMAAYVRESYVIDSAAVKAAISDWKGDAPGSWWERLKGQVWRIACR